MKAQRRPPAGRGDERVTTARVRPVRRAAAVPESDTAPVPARRRVRAAPRPTDRTARAPPRSLPPCARPRPALRAAAARRPLACVLARSSPRCPAGRAGRRRRRSAQVAPVQAPAPRLRPHRRPPRRHLAAARQPRRRHRPRRTPRRPPAASPSRATSTATATRRSRCSATACGGCATARAARPGPSASGRRATCPVVGDWDGDGVDTLGLFRSGRWFLRSSNGPLTAPAPHLRLRRRRRPRRSSATGTPTATPTSPSRRGATWYQRDAATRRRRAAGTSRFGRAGDLPVAGDWDHDGRDTPGLFRAGTWFFERRQRLRRLPDHLLRHAGRQARRPPHPGPRARRHATGSCAAAARSPTSPTVDLARRVEPRRGAVGRHAARPRDDRRRWRRRTGAVLGVNGDYFLSSGRPGARAGRRRPAAADPAAARPRRSRLDATGTRVRMGFPDARVVLTPTATGDDHRPADPLELRRARRRRRSSAYTAVGAGLDTPRRRPLLRRREHQRAAASAPDGGCRAALDRHRHPLLRRPRPTSARPAPCSPAGRGTARRRRSSRSLRAGQPIATTTYLGFPGAVDVLGGNPLLLVGRRAAVRPRCPAPATSSPASRAPRSASRPTAGCCVVVVDGRQRGYSAGMTLAELADLMHRARRPRRDQPRRRRQLVDVPSTAWSPTGRRDGYERGVGTALVVLPGADPGQADAAAVGAARTARPADAAGRRARSRHARGAPTLGRPRRRLGRGRARPRQHRRPRRRAHPRRHAAARRPAPRRRRSTPAA